MKVSKCLKNNNCEIEKSSIDPACYIQPTSLKQISKWPVREKAKPTKRYNESEYRKRDANNSFYFEKPKLFANSHSKENDVPRNAKDINDEINLNENAADNEQFCIKKNYNSDETLLSNSEQLVNKASTNEVLSDVTDQLVKEVVKLVGTEKLNKLIKEFLDITTAKKESFVEEILDKASDIKTPVVEEILDQASDIKAPVVGVPGKSTKKDKEKHKKELKSRASSIATELFKKVDDPAVLKLLINLFEDVLIKSDRLKTKESKVKIPVLKSNEHQKVYETQLKGASYDDLLKANEVAKKNFRRIFEEFAN